MSYQWLVIVVVKCGLLLPIIGIGGHATERVDQGCLNSHTHIHTHIGAHTHLHACTCVVVFYCPWSSDRTPSIESLLPVAPYPMLVAVGWHH